MENTEGFNEQVVKRVNKPKQLIIKIVAVIVWLTIPFIGASIAIITGIQYVFIVGLLVFLAAIYGVWYVFSSQKVEFEYSVVGNTLDVSKIISLRRRKRLCKVQINEIEELTRDGSKFDNARVTKTIMAAGDPEKKDEVYYALYNDPAYGKCLLLFSPNENIIKGMRPHLDKRLVIELFYRNKRS